MPTVLVKSTVTAGTRVALSATNLFVSRFSVQAKRANTGRVWIGDVTVAAAVGIEFEVPQANTHMAVVPFEGPDGQNRYNLANWYVDSAVNGNGVVVVYEQS